MRVFTNAISRRSKYEITKACTATAIQSSQMSSSSFTCEKRKLEEPSLDQPSSKRLVSQLMPDVHVLWCKALDLNDSENLVDQNDQTVLLKPKLFCGMQNTLFCDLKLLNDNNDLNMRFTTTYFLTSIIRRMISLVSSAKNLFSFEEETHTKPRDVQLQIALPASKLHVIALANLL